MPGADEKQTEAGQEAGKGQPEGQAQDSLSDVDGEGEPGLTLEQAQAEIKKLRKENANRRTSAKTLEERLQSMEGMTAKMKQALGIEDEKSSPEEVAKSLQAQNQMLELKLGISQIALANQIPAEKMEYFEFLFEKRLGTLQEGEEFGDEHISELIGQVKGLGQAQAPLKSGAGAKPPTPQAGEEVDVEKFQKMSLYEKQELYVKNEGLYTRLFQEAKQKGKIGRKF